MAGIHLSVGKALTLKRQYDEAIREINLFIKAEPKAADGYVFLGGVLQSDGRREAALQAYKRALQLDPTNKAARSALENISHSPGT